MEFFIHPTCFLPERAGPETALLHHPAVVLPVEQGGLRHRQGRDVAQELVVLADHIASSHHEANLRIGGEAVGHAPKGTGKEVIIGVEPAEDVAAGESKSFVDGIRLAPIWAFDHPRQSMAVALQHRGGAIAAAAIGHDDFDVAVILLEDR
jgi:hypothetical protein